MPSVYDKNFKYVPAAKTDISKTFARIRKQMAEEEARKLASNVKTLKRKEAK